MAEISRREFTKMMAATGIAAKLPQLEAAQRMIGIQVGAVSFVDEGVAPVLDRFQHDAGINTLFIATFSYGRGIAGRQIPGQPLPDHGKQEYDTNFHGGNFARVHPQYYAQTSLKNIQAQDYADFDVLEAVLPQAKARQMKTFCWYEDVFRRDLPGIDQLEEVMLSGKKAGTLCFHNPEVQGFWRALTEDFVRSYAIDGVMWGSERQGPFGNAIGAAHGGASHDPMEVTCFCEFCRREAQSRGIDVNRAVEGYTKLAAAVKQTRAGNRPADGYFVAFWRLLVQYPEILAWEKLWNDGLRTTYVNIHDTAKSARRDVQVGWHIWHNNSFSPLYRAEQDYGDFARYSDLLKVVMYNNCGGPRLASYVNSVSRTLFGDFSPQEVLGLTYKIQNYKEADLSDIPQRGLSSDYVARETRRARAGAGERVKILPGIDIDIPTSANEKKTEPQDVTAAVSAALGAGADGVILSRKYSEMRLRNLRAAGDALRACCPPLIPLLLLLLFSSRFALTQSKEPFAPDKMQTILYGVAYYPEYMPQDRLEKDVELMQKAGITVVRVGESTWSSWEPRDGDFQFAWMQRVLDRLQQAGIKAILGTPTYSIPTWLYKQHPEIAVTHNGTAPRLSHPYAPTYPPSLTPGYYGPRQNYDFLNPYFRQHAERIIREIINHFKDHPAVIGYQIDNETFPTGIPTPYMNAAFLERLKHKYKTPETINKIWGLVYWGQLVDKWEDLPSRDGILNPGYKLEWENFQHDVVTDYLAWQAKLVNEYKHPDQFITTDFSGGVHTNLNQWAIARSLDMVAENPYFETQDRLNGESIWLSGDLGRSLKLTNYLVTETNAQTIGWDSRTQYPQYPGQLRLVVYTHLAAGANMVEYWHWSSLHYGQETYWKGILSHDLEPNRTYAEMSRVAAELKRLGPQLVNLKKENKVAILFSADSANAISYMPVSDDVNYMSVLRQMHRALYQLNIEPDFIPADDPNLARYKVILVPPLYSASDAVLQRISEYVKNGGQAIMAFKSGFTDEHSTVRDVMAPGPLRAAAGFHYQEFTNLAKPLRLTPDPYKVGQENSGSVWAEFLVPETAEVVASYDHQYWKFPAITRNKYGSGILTYEGTVVTDALQREIIRDVLSHSALSGPDQSLPDSVKVRHGRNAQGKLLHYYLNFSGDEQTISYPYHNGSDLLTNAAVSQGRSLRLKPWDLAIVVEQ